MGIIVSDEVTADVIKVGDKCYKFVDIVDMDVTDTAAGEFATCEECESAASLGSTDLSSMSSLPVPSDALSMGSSLSASQLPSCEPAGSIACGDAGEGPAMLFTLSWGDTNVATRTFAGCTWCNGETRLVWPSTYDWKCQDMKADPACNVQQGYNSWQVSSFLMAIRGSAVLDGDSLLQQTASVLASVRYNGTQINKLNKKWRETGYTTLDDVADKGNLQAPWNLTGKNPTQVATVGLPGGSGWNLGVGTVSERMHTGSVYSAEDDLTISWEPDPWTWRDGSKDPEPVCNDFIVPAEASVGTATCGTPNSDPTLFMTLSWANSSPDDVYNITDAYKEAVTNNLVLELISHGISAGDTVTIQGLDVRQKVIDCFSFLVASVTANTISIDLNKDTNSNLYDIENITGTVTYSPTETKSWLGCTWANGETKEVYSVYYADHYEPRNTSPTSMPYGRSWRNIWKMAPLTNNYPPFMLNRGFQTFEHPNPTTKDDNEGALIALEPIGQSRKIDYFTINNYIGTYTVQQLNILSAGDRGKLADVALNKPNMMPASFTDSNGITYAWEEGNGW